LVVGVTAALLGAGHREFWTRLLSIPIVITVPSFLDVVHGREATADIPAVKILTLLSSHGSPQGPRGLA
jgi:hypothetical protein